MLSIMSGPMGTVHPGQETEVADGLGKSLVAGGFAIDVTQPPTAPPAKPKERATVNPGTETAEAGTSKPAPPAGESKAKDDGKGK